MAELATLASLEDRVRARIHESIGDLITEADLEELVKKGIRQTFFEGTTEYVGPQYNRQVETPAMIHKILAELLTERVDKAVDEWIADHEDKVRAIVAACVADGAAKAVLWRFNRVFQSDVDGYSDNSLRNLFGS